MMNFIDQLFLYFLILCLPVSFAVGYFYQEFLYLDDLQAEKQKENWKKAERLTNANLKF